MQSLYIAGAGSGTGKSLVVLGVMDHLMAVNRKLGFFRPIIRQTPEADPLIALMRDRYALPFPPESLYGCTARTAQEFVGRGQYDELLKRILNRFKELERRCDLVVCAGTDYEGLVPSIEFDFNADLANNLGCTILVVIKGFGRGAEEILQSVRLAHESLIDRGGELLATFVNGVPADQLTALREQLRAALPSEESVYVIPEEPGLQMPTVAEIRNSLAARCLCGDRTALNQVVTNYKIAAMGIPEFLRYVEDGCLIITPGDRADIILASLIADRATTYPRVAGLLLTGGLEPAETVRRLMEGLPESKVSLLQVATDTYTTAIALRNVEAAILPGDDRKIATALGLFENAVDIRDLRQRISLRRSSRRTPLMFEYELIQRAKAQRRHIVLPEGSDDRILRAAEILSLRDVVDLSLLGDPESVGHRIAELGLKLAGIPIIDPARSPDRARYAETYFRLRAHKGISRQMAYDLMEDPSYFGTAMVYHDDAHGMVSGAVHTTQHTIRPAFEIIKTRPGVRIVSSVFFMCLADRVLVYGDCAVNPNPTSEQLAEIAISSAETAAAFGIEPRVALLSYSTGTSGKGADVDRVRRAVDIARRRRPDLCLEGPMQYDAAVDPSVARSKLPESAVAGRATVLIFPDLNTGNNTYKAVQRSAGAVAIGPILQGLNKPVNDLSRGCLVTDIVNTVAITAIQSLAPRETAR